MYTLTRGRNYNLAVTVTNRSKLAGVDVKADLTVLVRIPIAGFMALEQSLSAVIGAGLSNTFIFTFTANPLGRGEIRAWVYPTSDTSHSLATASETLDVVDAAAAPVSLVVSLAAGGNFVGYLGPSARMSVVLSSIIGSLRIVYRITREGFWAQVLDESIMVGGRAYLINALAPVSWEFERAPISSIALDHGWNAVVYPGPAKNIADAVASLWGAIAIPGIYKLVRFESSGPAWEEVFSTHTMIPGGIYLLQTNREIIWTW